MKRTITIAGLGALFALATAPAQAAVITLFDYAFNVDGTTTAGGPLPATLDAATGLGSLSFTVTGGGAHNVAVFLDHEIDEAINTFFNESGATGGAPAAGQSWEIDEPGFLFGDIYTNLFANTLDGSNGVPAGAPDDVSMALGWNLFLAPGETAVASFFVSLIESAPGFFLTQLDPRSETSLFFWSTLDIRGGEEPPPPTSVPEPTTLALLAAGLLSLGLRRRRR